MAKSALLLFSGDLREWPGYEMQRAFGRLPSSRRRVVMLKRELTRFIREEEAATAVEYAVIAALVGVALIGVLTQFSGSIQAMFRRAINALR